MLEWINSDTGQPLAPGDTGPYYWRLSMRAEPQIIAITDDAGREAAVREINELADAPSQSAEADLRRDLTTAVAQYDEVKRLREVEASYRKAAETRDAILPDPQMLFFGYNHLPPGLQEVSRPFHAMAQWMIKELPDNDQRTIALQRLLEAKDAALRSKLLPRG